MDYLLKMFFYRKINLRLVFKFEGLLKQLDNTELNDAKERVAVLNFPIKLFDSCKHGHKIGLKIIRFSVIMSVVKK